MDDDALEVPDDRLLVVAQFDRERAAEPVGDVSHRLRRLPGVVWEDHPVGAERSGREPNVRRHAVVAAPGRWPYRRTTTSRASCIPAVRPRARRGPFDAG